VNEKSVFIMASNFRIFVHRNSDSLHLKLAGDFDGTSAFELLDMVKKKGAGLRKVFIHTSSLKTIYPFGLQVFEKSLSELKAHPSNSSLQGSMHNRLRQREAGACKCRIS